MDTEEFSAALGSIDRLSREEYQVSVASLASAAADAPDATLARLGRLVGVMMKEPFAAPTALPAPSQHTGAVRSWEPMPRDQLDEAALRSTWQYRTLDALRTDPEVTQSLGWTPPDVYQIAMQLQYERGFFGCLAISLRKYVCGDKELRKKIQDNIEAAKQSGLDVRRLTPEAVVASGAAALGAVLVQHVPAMGYLGVPGIAGVVLVMYSVGVDAFCRWVTDLQLRGGTTEDQ